MIRKTDLWKALKTGQRKRFFEQELTALMENEKQKRPWPDAQWQALEAEAESYAEAVLKNPMEDFFAFFQDGTRMEAAYFQKRKYLLVFGLLLLREPQSERYRHDLEQVIWSICNDLYWSLPAHFMGVDQEPVGIAGNENLLDLFSCETGFALAEILFLHEDKLNDQLCAVVRDQLMKRIIAPYLDMGQVHRFELMSNNWSSVCSSAVGAVALYMTENDEMLTNILMRVINGLDVYLASFGADGICMEGFDYWTYGFGFFVCFADLLKQRTNGICDLFRNEKVKQIAMTQHQYFLSGDHMVSFSDCQPVSHYRIGTGSYLSRTYAEVKLPELSCSADILEDTCYRFCLGLRDLLWYDEKTESGCCQPDSVYFPDAQWFISRTEVVQLAAKGGSNAESHNHNDVGSFMLFKRGQEFLCDPGAGVYNKDYFGARRYDNFLTSARSHNVPVINGSQQQYGEMCRAGHVQAELTEEKDSFQAELGSCYREEGLHRFIRTITVDKKAQIVILEDNFSFLEAGKVAEHFVSSCPFEIHESEIQIRGEKETITIQYDAELFCPEIYEEEYSDQRYVRRTVYILELKNKVPAREIRAVIYMS